jgi:hypothetical protein
LCWSERFLKNLFPAVRKIRMMRSRLRNVVAKAIASLNERLNGLFLLGKHEIIFRYCRIFFGSAGGNISLKLRFRKGYSLKIRLKSVNVGKGVYSRIKFSGKRAEIYRKSNRRKDGKHQYCAQKEGEYCF